jgi:hypothetical protein
MSEFTRRSFIGKTAIAIGSFAALQKVVNAANPTDPGPANRVLDGQNSDSMWPPGTDSKSLVQNFKYPFSFATSLMTIVTFIVLMCYDSWRCAPKEIRLRRRIAPIPINLVHLRR